MLTFLFIGAQESIYSLDWWLSPELYLRRPPSRNEQYRLDALLQAAAERGVQVNVIVYKEVEAALTLDSAVCIRNILFPFIFRDVFS
jgi:phospholipase D1/2